MLRAVFDNGSGLRTGMDVRVSGIEVGSVRSVELDQSSPAMPRAVAVIAITDASAAAFRRDGRCAIRSATLLGDRFVDCKITQPRSPGAPPPPPLGTVKVDGAEQHLLPLERTSSPVDPDLLLDVFRLPVRQRLSIIINELGAGLAGNGEALQAAVRRARPGVPAARPKCSPILPHSDECSAAARATPRTASSRRLHVSAAGRGWARPCTGNRAVSVRRASARALRQTFRRLPRVPPASCARPFATSTGSRPGAAPRSATSIRRGSGPQRRDGGAANRPRPAGARAGCARSADAADPRSGEALRRR